MADRGFILGFAAAGTITIVGTGLLWYYVGIWAAAIYSTGLYLLGRYWGKSEL